MGRNLVKLKKNDGVISNSKVLRHNRDSDVSATEKVESLHCLFVFGWIKLKFVVRDNFRLPILNLNSITQYRFEILRKMTLFFSSIMIFSPALPQGMVTMATMNDMSSIF